MQGIIVRSLSGFYYVDIGSGVVACRAKGVFRKEGVTPLTGDRVEIETQGETGTVCAVLERKNAFTRPPIANVDLLCIVSSVTRPRPNLFVIDKLSAFSVYRNVEPVFVFSKADTADASEFVEIYRRSGFRSFACSAVTGEGFENFPPLVRGKTCVFTGNSGVGKSSIINALIPSLSLETNEISDKLGRGRHTTRSVSLYAYEGGYLADTPGFSSMETDTRGETIKKEALADCFPEFAQFTGACRFSVSCCHVKTRGCGVLRAVEEHRIPATRYESYARMYEEVRTLPDWEKR